MKNRLTIHQQLLDDCHYLGTLPACTVLLHHDAAVPWFILVPDTEAADILDLETTLAQSVLQDCRAVSVFIKQTLGYRKVNFAGLGNVVPQMHLHVIGRSAEDPCWPQPVWGNLDSDSRYTSDKLRSLQSDLVRTIGLIATTI